MHLDVQDDPAISAEVERLLARRTRDIRLTGEINRLFRARVWSQTAKIIRAWMIWVAFLDVLTLALNMVMLPKAIALSMLLPGAIIPPVVVAVVLVWRKPQAPWLQGASLIAGMFLILLSVALVGVSAGGEFYERHLNIMLFVAITAIIIFGIPLAWTMTIAALRSVSISFSSCRTRHRIWKRRGCNAVFHQRDHRNGRRAAHHDNSGSKDVPV